MSTHRSHLYWVLLLLLLTVTITIGSDEKGANVVDQIQTQGQPSTQSTTTNDRASIKVISQDETVVDSSWPTLHDYDSEIFQRVAPLRQKMRYREYLKGCINDASEEECLASEQSRLKRNRYQPTIITRNVTETGYTKLSIPPSVNTLLQNFWKKNRQFAWTEFWQGGDMGRNYWQQNCSVLDLGRKDFPNSLHPSQLHHLITTVQQELETWTSQPLVFSAAVGIRAYLENTILAPHVDRLPFVITAALHIAQHNIDDEWPLQLVVKDENSGQPILKNVTSEPGEMIVYEGTSIIHGRPYPLPKGSLELTELDDPTYMAVLYLHFEPLGFTVQQTLQQQQTWQNEEDTTMLSPLYDDMPTTTVAMAKASEAAFERALAFQKAKAQSSKEENTNPTNKAKTMPRYVWKTYEDMYQQRFAYEHEAAVYPKPAKVVFGQISPHQAAALGDLTSLKSLASRDRTLLFKADANGWRPLHEAARSGYADVLEYLLEEGAQVNARTNDGEGGTALYWAEKEPKKNVKAIAVLKKYGGVNIPPNYKDD